MAAKKRKPSKVITTEILRVLREVEEVLMLSDPEGNRTRKISAPEDPQILELCQRIGFGAVMDSAARQWRTMGDLGAIGAHTVGACVGTVQATLTMVRELIVRVEAAQ